MPKGRTTAFGARERPERVGSFPDAGHHCPYSSLHSQLPPCLFLLLIFGSVPTCDAALQVHDVERSDGSALATNNAPNLSAPIEDQSRRYSFLVLCAVGVC